MTVIFKSTGGPGDGFFPGSHQARCRNRSTTAMAKGDAGMLILSDAEALGATSALTTSDSNTYRPGAGDATEDSIWNTVVDSTANGILNGGIVCVCLDPSVAVGNLGNFQFYGVVEQAFVISTGTVQCGDPLTIAIATESFDAETTSNETLYAIYIDAEDATISTRALKRIFLHNGFFGGRRGNI